MTRVTIKQAIGSALRASPSTRTQGATHSSGSGTATHSYMVLETWSCRHVHARLQASRPTTLFAALNALDGSVIAMCQPRHRHDEWLKFLRRIKRSTPKHLSLHLVVDEYATHRHPEVQEWLARNPRFVMHFTPTSGSWLNMVERFFRDITTERLRRGVFTSVPELEAAINEYVADAQARSRVTGRLPRDRRGP